jgi:hypothetical protein
MKNIFTSFFFLYELVNSYNIPENTTYNKIIFPGTHNSYSNLYNPTLPPVPSYKKFILNQQWSIKDQLNKGIRVLDIELNSIFPPTKCPNSPKQKNKNCTFIVSHGTAQEAIELKLGYSFLDDIFLEIKEWISSPSASFSPLTLILNKQDTHIKNKDILDIFHKTNLSSYVYLYDTEITPDFKDWPTIRDMKKQKKPLMVFGINKEHRMLQYQNWFINSKCDAYNDRHNSPTIWRNPSTNKTICIDQGWDGAQLENFYTNHLIIPNTPKNQLFVLNILLSPRDLHNFPFIFGGNPLTQPKANNYHILYNLTKKANQILAKNNQQVNWILVDFFDTIYKEDTDTWSSNPYEGLINVTQDLNKNYNYNYNKNYHSNKSFL